MDGEGFGYSRTQYRVGNFREMPGSDILKQGYLKKLKTMKKKYFVLRSTSSSGPARLDYHDNEKKFKANQPPKRSINLHVCFNINKKSDTKHKFAIALYLLNDCFSVITEDQEEQNRWLSLMLEYQNEYLLEGDMLKPHYEYVWQGMVKQKSPKSCPGIQGPYRLCLSEKSVSLVKVSEYQASYDFMLSSIRRCGHSDNCFFMEVGRSAVTGQGELWMQVEETSIAQGMHDKVLSEMTSRQADFRGRSNTGGSIISRRSTIHGDESFIRKRATSESLHGQGSPRRMPGMQRPQSTVVYHKTLAPEPPLVLPSNNPHSPYDTSFFEDRVRSDSMGSRSSRTSKHSDFMDSLPYYQNVEPITSPEHSFVSVRSQTPETPVSITEEDPMDMENSDYLSMTPGQRSMTPSPTRFQQQGQMERSTTSSDYLPMTPTRRSGTPSPTRFQDRPGSVSSEPQDVSIMSEGYMDMRPGSVVSSPASNSSGYIDMMPGQRTPTDPGPGYMIMDAGWNSRGTAPIPIRSAKEVGYMDMGPSSQPLPTVKEGGSGEAYLPMSPSGQSPMSSEGLKPAKVFSYLSDDSMSGELPKRAYSVGSRPMPTYRTHQIESLRRQPLDSSKSSSAPHLIVQKTRQQNMDPYNKNYMDMSSNASSLNQSLRSDDGDSFMEMDFYRPRTASDSYGCRPRSSSFGKQIYQGHRPRSSSYGQASKLSNLVTSARVDSFESVRRTSQDLMNRKRSQESLGKYSCSSSESLKKLSEDKKASSSSDYMDMGFDKNKTNSPTVHGIGSPIGDPAGYVDMTLGSSIPKSQRGISPSSSSHSLGSSPASGFGHHLEKSHEATKVVHASGKVAQKQGFKPAFPGHHSEQQLKVATSRLKQGEKKSPASSGKESEDESYVPFQPGASGDNTGKQLSGSHDFIPRNHPGIKVQHGYSRSHDSAVKQVESSKKSKNRQNKKEEKNKQNVPKQEKHEKESKGKKEKDKGKQSKDKTSHEKGSSVPSPKTVTVAAAGPKSNLQVKIEQGHSPTIDRKIDFIPETDLFSNAIYNKSVTSSDQTPNKSSSSVNKGDDSGYMEYLPGSEVNSPASNPDKDKNKSSENKKGSTGFVPSIGMLNTHSADTKTKQGQLKNTKSKAGAEPREPELPQSNVDNKVTSESDYVLSDPVTNAGIVANYVLSDPVKNASIVAESDYVLSDPVTNAGIVAESDYVLSDPVSNAGIVADAMSSPGGKNVRPVEDTFSYMDFDPASAKSAIRYPEPIKSPAPVQSFFAPTNNSDTWESGQGKSADVVKCSPNSGTQCGESKDCSVGESRSGDSKRKGKQIANSKSKKQEVNKARANVSKDEVVSETVKAGDKTTVIDKKSSNSNNKKENVKRTPSKSSSIGADELVAKFVVVKNTEQEIMDEGYIELDFTPKPDCKNHRRSGSASSTTSATSDRSRKGAESCIEESVPNPSPIVSFISVENDNLPKPEIPVSYICDNAELSFKSNSLIKEPSSPSKQGGGSRSSIESGMFCNKLQTSTGSLDSNPSGEVFTSAPIQALNISQANQIFGQLSRQSSMPLGPSFSPRTSEDIQSIRSRKASGPATLSGARKSSGGSNSIGKQLETLPAGQELQKQVSMPCMNIPASLDKIRTEKSDMGQRHSYTDLSQYEEMSQVGNLDKIYSGKSNSQQQLSDADQESKLNYADLDLKGSSENVDEKSPRVNYATINFEKTESLKNANVKDEV